MSHLPPIRRPVVPGTTHADKTSYLRLPTRSRCQRPSCSCHGSACKIGRCQGQKHRVSIGRRVRRVCQNKSLSVEKRRKRDVHSQHLSRPIASATKTTFRVYLDVRFLCDAVVRDQAARRRRTSATGHEVTSTLATSHVSARHPRADITAYQAILKTLGWRFVAWRSSSSE